MSEEKWKGKIWKGVNGEGECIRVAINVRKKDGACNFLFQRLVAPRRIKTTRLSLSSEASFALMDCLISVLQKPL